MPEIYEMFFNLSELLRLIPKNNEIEKQVKIYEKQLENNMEENRLKLFSEYGYNNEFGLIY